MFRVVGVGRVLADASQTVSTYLVLLSTANPSLPCRNKVHRNPAVLGDDWRW